jgi:hypothetical protein
MDPTSYYAVAYIRRGRRGAGKTWTLHPTVYTTREAAEAHAELMRSNEGERKTERATVFQLLRGS